ncbi:MAG: LCP family protein [Firmicutes bacterium]|nr:LCP family protein [Bacillota bacterium]
MSKKAKPVQTAVSDGAPLPNERPGRRSLRLLRKFLVTFFLTFLGLCIVGGLSFFMYLRSQIRPMGSSESSAAQEQVHQQVDSGLKQQNNPIVNFFSSVPKRVNFVIFGLDGSGRSTRSDTMILGCFNTEKSTLDFVSLPRDVPIVMPKDRRDLLASYGRWTPSGGAMKLGEVYAYAGDEYGPEFATKQIEELVGVKIEYYATVDLEAFKYIVNELGGVEFDVPYRMKYKDDLQGLNIDLRPGLQLLDGDAAEGLVRFRDHDNTLGGIYTDWNRGETQQLFIKAMLTQMAAKGIVANLPTFVSTALNYVKTNFDPVDLPKYINYVKNLGAGDINTHLLVGDDRYDGSAWYTYLDMDASMRVIDSIFYDAGEPKRVSSVGKKIQVLNGGYTAGMAQKTSDELTSQGFTVAGIGDYTGTQQAGTRILVKDDGMGEDLLPLFAGASLIVAENECADAGVDIIIILGTDAG